MPGIDLSVNLAGLGLEYFWMNASGFLATAPAYARFAGFETGAVMGKTIDLKEIEGNETPNFTQLSQDLFANSIGLSGAGVKNRREEMAWTYPLTRPDPQDPENEERRLKVPFIDSIKPQETPEKTAELIYLLEDLYDAIELNVSCPNVPEGMKVGQDTKLTEQYARACKEAMPEGKPLIIKLTPNVKDIGEIARAAIGGGTDVISGINTLDEVGEDYSKARAVLGRPPGGISGPGILKMGLERVGEIYQAIGRQVPIIGMGGIKTAEDAIEYLRRGADAVAIGTCLFLDRPMEIPNSCNPNETVKQFLEKFRDDVLREIKSRDTFIKSPADIKGAFYEC